jgi:hypothetical protein
MMNNRLSFLLVFLLSGMSVDAAAVPPENRLPAPGIGAVTCLAADQSGCGILIRRGVNEEGYYYLTIDTTERGADSVKVTINGRSIMISRSEFRRSQRTNDRGAYGVVSRSSRFASRFRLPPDADMRRVKREEDEGVITIIIPRLQIPRPGPNPFGYRPYR